MSDSDIEIVDAINPNGHRRKGASSLHQHATSTIKHGSLESSRQQSSDVSSNNRKLLSFTDILEQVQAHNPDITTHRSHKIADQLYKNQKLPPRQRQVLGWDGRPLRIDAFGDDTGHITRSRRTIGATWDADTDAHDDINNYGGYSDIDDELPGAHYSLSSRHDRGDSGGGRGGGSRSSLQRRIDEEHEYSQRSLALPTGEGDIQDVYHEHILHSSLAARAKHPRQTPHGDDFVPTQFRSYRLQQGVSARQRDGNTTTNPSSVKPQVVRQHGVSAEVFMVTNPTEAELMVRGRDTHTNGDDNSDDDLVEIRVKSARDDNTLRLDHNIDDLRWKKAWHTDSSTQKSDRRNHLSTAHDRVGIGDSDDDIEIIHHVQHQHHPQRHTTGDSRSGGRLNMVGQHNRYDDDDYDGGGGRRSGGRNDSQRLNHSKRPRRGEHIDNNDDNIERRTVHLDRDNPHSHSHSDRQTHSHRHTSYSAPSFTSEQHRASRVPPSGDTGVITATKIEWHPCQRVCKAFGITPGPLNLAVRPVKPRVSVINHHKAVHSTTARNEQHTHTHHDIDNNQHRQQGGSQGRSQAIVGPSITGGDGAENIHNIPTGDETALEKLEKYTTLLHTKFSTGEVINPMNSFNPSHHHHTMNSGQDHHHHQQQQQQQQQSHPLQYKTHTAITSSLPPHLERHEQRGDPPPPPSHENDEQQPAKPRRSRWGSSTR